MSTSNSPISKNGSNRRILFYYETVENVAIVNEKNHWNVIIFFGHLLKLDWHSLAFPLSIWMLCEISNTLHIPPISSLCDPEHWILHIWISHFLIMSLRTLNIYNFHRYLWMMTHTLETMTVNDWESHWCWERRHSMLNTSHIIFIPTESKKWGIHVCHFFLTYFS